MKKNIRILLLFPVVFLMACSTTTWIVESQEEVDRGDYKLLNSKLFLQKVGTITPELPVAQFRLKAANTFEYAQRVKTDRYIQKYRPRLGYVALGAAAAGLGGYTALEFSDPNKQGQQIALLGASTALMGISFLNMKPIGEPQPTGETRLLRKTGVFVDTDTLDATVNTQQLVSFTIRYADQILVEKSDVVITKSNLSINFLEELNPDIFPGQEDIAVDLDITFDDSLYSYKIPIKSIFDPFVVVNTTVTALRNQARLSSTNILTDLAQGSQLKLVEAQQDWVKVLYGISENWVSSSDVDIIWRPSQFSRELSVVAIPNVPFGSVDVERDIPGLSEDDRSKWGFIIANQGYSGSLPEKAYAHRDGQLIEKYLNDALGIVPTQTIKFQDISGSQTARNGFNRLVSRVNNREIDLVVYLNGYAEVDPKTDKVYFLGTSTDSAAARIDLNSILDGFANLPVRKLTIVADLDFITSSSRKNTLELLAATVTTQVQNSTVVFSSNTDQRSYIYAEPNGVQKRHSIFTYFFADAIKKRNTGWGNIKNYLDRNVSFTSRSIFNAAQDIRFFGSDSLSLID
ncbi:MAG: hypothetical protein JJ892_03085 [Balneola sp.]|nr:hypothetical protein [Balneola sp.]MBO6650189.1 hypothetical protein [Balneola sp.]MBO6710553.1 hypothetical protein [Balneola sp.]MBO6799238.1 hypothetical protein [Balneola sp.]MBO6871077.1 hypothetical protein [Balneola sp.]